MIRHFVMRPSASYQWRGRCLVAEDGRSYTHYPNWPSLQPNPYGVNVNMVRPIDEELRDAPYSSFEWVEIMNDPDLEVDEGL